MRRIIREDDPEHPSTRLNASQDTREVAAHRCTAVSQVRDDAPSGSRCRQSKRPRSRTSTKKGAGWISNVLTADRQRSTRVKALRTATFRETP